MTIFVGQRGAMLQNSLNIVENGATRRLVRGMAERVGFGLLRLLWIL